MARAQHLGARGELELAEGSRVDAQRDVLGDGERSRAATSGVRLHPKDMVRVSTAAALEAVCMQTGIEAARGARVRALANPIGAAVVAAVDGAVDGVSGSTYAIPHRARPRIYRLERRLHDAQGGPRTVGGAVFRRGALTMHTCMHTYIDTCIAIIDSWEWTLGNDRKHKSRKRIRIVHLKNTSSCYRQKEKCKSKKMRKRRG